MIFEASFICYDGPFVVHYRSDPNLSMIQADEREPSLGERIYDTKEKLKQKLQESEERAAEAKQRQTSRDISRAMQLSEISKNGR